MSLITKAKDHLSVEEVKRHMQNEKEPWRVRRWEIIYNAMVDPRKASEIALHLGISVSLVHKVVADYNKYGVKAFNTPGTGGWRWGYMSPEEEREFLNSIAEQASRGSFITVAKIKCAYEERVGHPVHFTTIYKILWRNKWSKKVPRPQHVKTDKNEQTAFKKTLYLWCNKSLTKNRMK